MITTMEFIGNQNVLNRLNRVLDRQLIGHAYLFSGPEGVGKFLMAKLFSSAVITNTGDIMRDFVESSLDHPDCLILEPEVEEKKGVRKIKDIPIESIRDAQHQLSLYPLSGKKRVLIIRDAHRLTIAAQSALLKTLEEPADTTMLILVTHDAGRLLPTIHSRCQAVNFSLVVSSEIDKLPKLADALPEVRNLTQQLSFGRPGRSAMLLESEDERERWAEMLKSARMLNQMGITERLALAEKLSKDTARAKDFLSLWLWVTHEDSTRNGTLVESAAPLELASKAQTIILTTNANVRLVLDNAFLEA